MAKQAILATEDELELDFTAGADEEEDNGEALDMNFGFGEDETPEDDDDESDKGESTDDGEEADEGDDDGEAEETEESDEDEGEETDEEEEEGEPDKGGEDDTPEAESEEEGEEEEPEDAGKAKASKSGPMIPKTRFDQVLNKNRALQAKLDALEAKNAKADEGDKEPEAYDFDAKEAEYQDLILDGDTKKAADLRREIRAAERAEIMAEVNKSTSESNTQDRVADALQDAAQEWYDAYPPLNPDSDNFDKDLTADIVRVRNGLIASGSNAVDALNEAVELQLARRGLIEPEGQTKEEPKPAVRKKRKKSSVAAKIKAQRSQPAEQGGEGAATRASEDEIDLDKLSDEEFDALPAKTLARLRGDVL
ncbi:MAG: hypothetical protein MJH10_09860 [Epibacterium sp.]|nr:hypothetical protein [Epibacterium sp.]NQX73841.1 hypothetical protein [Epibacterium sp.]